MSKRYTISIETDNPDGEAIVRDATEKIACQLDWGDGFTTSIETVEEGFSGAHPLYLVGYEMEPGKVEARPWPSPPSSTTSRPDGRSADGWRD